MTQGVRHRSVTSEMTAQQLLQKGHEALSLSDLDRAGRICRLLVTRFPRLTESHFLVGLVAVEMSDWPMAVKAMKSVIALNRQHQGAWAQLARSFAMMGQFANAENALGEAVRLPAGNSLTLDVIGTVFSLLGDQEKAQAWQERAVAKAPKPGLFHVSLARTLIFTGKLDKAESLLKLVLKQAPDNARAHWMLSGLKKAQDETHIEQMQDCLSGAREKDRAFLYYAVGKECEDLGLWENAFDAFSAGAKAKRRTIEFDEESEKRLFEVAHQNFTSAWLHQQKKGVDDPAPIFIVGQPRTGTTLVERTLAAHSDVHAAGELQQFAMVIKKVTGLAAKKPMTAEILAAAAAEDMAKLGQAYLEAVKPVRGDSPRFIDKLPVNALYAPLIAAALPRATIIHVTRHAVDSCFSSFKQLFADAYFHSYDQEEMARHHIRYRKLMDQWDAVLSSRWFTVPYEDLVMDHEGWTRRILDYTGLSLEEGCFNFHAAKDAVTTASAVQVREKAHTKSVGRWQRYEKQLTPTINLLKRAGLID